MQQAEAEIIAVQCLGWLSEQQDLFGVFLGSTGADAGAIRELSESPEFLGAILDFLLMDEENLMAFCDSADLAYEKPFQARQALPGGEQVHWT